MARDDFLDPVEQAEMQAAFAQPATGREIAKPEAGTDLSITEGVITARKVDVARDEGKVLQRIGVLAAAAGTRWLYAFPVKQKGGGTKTIEGLSIKGANTVARLFGNCSVDCRVLDAGKAWIIYARFVDYESGYSLTRPFEQAKDASRLGGEDESRRQQIALSIGVSKAERNVIVNALQDHADYAMDAAKASLVDRVGKKLPEYKQRCIDRLGELGVTTNRAERALGKPVSIWLARDVARLIAEIKAVQDGMATADEQWPTEPPPEPRRSDVLEQPSREDAPTSEAQAQAEAGPEAARQEQPAAPPPSADDEALPDKWLVGEVAGQDELIMRLTELIEQATNNADLDAIERINAGRIKLVGGTKGAALRELLRNRRTQFGKAIG